MPTGRSNKSMLGGSGGNSSSFTSDYLSQISKNTATKTDIKTVEDIETLVGYFNNVIADIQARKKKM
jgi:hypothetical protein